MLDQSTSIILPKRTRRVLPDMPSARTFSAVAPGGTTGSPTSLPASMSTLLLIMACVSSRSSLAGCVAIPVLPLHVHDDLGLSPFVVGLVAGSQFVTSLVARPMAGRHADRRGAKHAVVFGLMAAAASGMLYLASLQFRGQPITSVTICCLAAPCSASAKASSSRARKPGG